MVQIIVEIAKEYGIVVAFIVLVLVILFKLFKNDIKKLKKRQRKTIALILIIMLLFSIFYLFVKGKEKYYQQKNCESLVNNVQSEFINIALTKSNIINNSIEIEKRLYIINNDILAIRKNCKNNNILENK